MKRFFLSFIVVASSASFLFAQRLPDLATPENYQLTFSPDFQKDNFAGDETIHVRILKPTSQILLNSAEIVYQEATVSSEGRQQPVRVSLDKDKEMATLSFDSVIQPGPAEIRIKFQGILNDELRACILGKIARAVSTR